MATVTLHIRDKTNIAVFFMLLFLIINLSFSSSVLADYNSYDLKDWLAFDESSREVVDHSLWNRILKKYVKTDNNGLNRFDCGAMPPAERRALVHYIESLSKIKVSTLNRPEQLAYWINLYNASMVGIIIRHYPVRSILKIGGKLTSRGPWGTITLEKTSPLGTVFCLSFPKNPVT